MDRCCTDILEQSTDLTAPALSPAPHQPIHVGFPNNTSARSIGSATLTANHIEVPVSVMRQQDLHSPLLGITPFTSQQCTAEFNDTTAIIRTPDGDPCIVAHKDKAAKAWRIDLHDINPHGQPFSMLPGASAAHVQPFYNAECDVDLPDAMKVNAAANLVQRFEGVQERVNFSQALMLHIPIRTLLKAMKLGWIDDWLPCTAAQLQAYGTDTHTTHVGHMKEKRQNIDSTKITPIQDTDPTSASPSADRPSTSTPTPPAWWNARTAGEQSDDDIKSMPLSYCFVRPISQDNVLFADAKHVSGPRSRLGYTHQLVFSHHNCVHVEWLKGADGATVANGYERGLKHYDHLPGATAEFMRIDNQTSPQLRELLQRRKRDDKPITLQYCAVGIHRANKAEKIIQDYESMELSALAQADPQFPLAYWYECTEQILITMNSTRPYSLDPSISAYHGVYGHRYDFKAHPMTILGSAISRQVDRKNRDPALPFKAHTGFYLGPALENYRAARILVLDKGGKFDVQVEQQFAVHLRPQLRAPRLSAYEEVAAATKDLTKTLRNLSKEPDAAAKARPPLLQVAQRIHTLFGLSDSDQGSTDNESDEELPAVQRVSEPASPAVQRVSEPASPEVQRAPEPLPPPPVRVDISPNNPTAKRKQQRASSTAAVSTRQSDRARTVNPRYANAVTSTVAKRAARQRKKSRYHHNQAIRTAFAAQCAAFIPACTAAVSITPPPVPEEHEDYSSVDDEPWWSPRHPQMIYRHWVNNTISAATRVQLTFSYEQACATQAANAAIDADIDAARAGHWSELFHEGPDAYANRTLNFNDDGTKITYQSVFKGEDGALWVKENENEFYKLIRDTKTMHATHYSDIPADRRGEISYYSPQVKEKMKESGLQRRVRGTYGANNCNYTGRKSAKTAELEVVKSLANAAVSEDANLASADLKDFYLAEELERPEYLRIPLKLFTDKVLDELNLRQFIDRDCIYFEVVRTMYGLPQAGYLSQKGLVKHLNQAGYFEDPIVPMLFTHQSNGVSFCLVVDDFIIKYKQKSALDHLLNTLRAKYEVTVDDTCSKYLGMHFLHDKAKRIIRITMPGYVRKMLHQFQHCPVTPQQSPSTYVSPMGGAKAQLPYEDHSGALDPEALHTLQSIIGGALYYGRTVDPLVLPQVCALASEQATATQDTLAQAYRLLGFMMANPDNGIEYRASNMKLWTYSDASYLSRSRARSVAGGHHYASDETGAFNGSICSVSTIIDVVVGSAYEAEVGATYINGQRAEWLREIFRALGYPQGRTPLVTDNAVAVGFANDTIQHAKTKAIDMRYHWVRDRVRQGHFDIFWVPGDSNIADYFTKALPVHEHQRWAPVLVKMPSQETRQAPGPKLAKSQRTTKQRAQ